MEIHVEEIETKASWHPFYCWMSWVFTCQHWLFTQLPGQSAQTTPSKPKKDMGGSLMILKKTQNADTPGSPSFTASEDDMDFEPSAGFGSSGAGLTAMACSAVSAIGQRRLDRINRLPCNRSTPLKKKPELQTKLKTQINKDEQDVSPCFKLCLLFCFPHFLFVLG